MSDPLKLKPSQQREITSALALLTQIGLNTTIIIAGCVLFGRFLDAKLGTSPVLVLVFALLGMASAFYSLYKTALKATGTKNRSGDKDV